MFSHILSIVEFQLIFISQNVLPYFTYFRIPGNTICHMSLSPIYKLPFLNFYFPICFTYILPIIEFQVTQYAICVIALSSV